jgi:hypothetical protein
MTATFTEAIKKKDEEYRKDIEQAKLSVENAEKEKLELKASVEQVQEQLAEALSKINEFETQRKTAEALARFNVRMQEIDEAFELDDEDRQVLAEDIKNLEESEEAFAAFKKKLGVMWKSKDKKAKQEKEKEMKAAIDAEVEKRISELKSKASASVEDALDKVQASEVGMPNNNEQSSQAPKSLIEKFKGAFSKDNITIS